MKLEDLAIYTGKPYWETPLAVGKPDTRFKDEFLKRAGACFDRGILANNGPEVTELEERMYYVTGRPYVVPVTNGTVGLELCLRVLDRPGATVVPAWTFPAAPHATLFAGSIPVFVDAASMAHRPDLIHQPNLDDLEHLLDTESIGSAIGFLAWGRANGCAEWAEECELFDVPVILDAAHALGCQYPRNRWGLAWVYSLHATKQVGGFEGGVVCTYDQEFASELRRVRNFGFSKQAPVEIASYGYAEIVQVGTNAKMHEISAAMANVSLSHLDETIELYHDRHYWYQKGLAGIDGVFLLEYPPGHNFQYVVVEWEPRGVGLGHVCDILRQEGVHARRYFAPGCHNMKPFLRYASGQAFPVADRLATRTLVLPTGPQVAESDVTRICDVLRTIRDGIRSPGLPEEPSSVQ